MAVGHFTPEFKSSDAHKRIFRDLCLVVIWLNIGFLIYKVVMMVPDLTELGEL